MPFDGATQPKARTSASAEDIRRACAAFVPLLAAVEKLVGAISRLGCYDYACDYLMRVARARHGHGSYTNRPYR
jgi:hypothetical protein